MTVELLGDARQRARDRRLRADLTAGRIAPTPARITLALDAPVGCPGPLEGPGVDEFCGVAEPTVDRWEAGEETPTPGQLDALAALTGYPLGFFFLPPPTLDLDRVWACRIEEGVSGEAERLALASARRPVAPPGPLPECSGCAAPMRRATWTAQHGRCSACSPSRGESRGRR